MLTVRINPGAVGIGLYYPEMKQDKRKEERDGRRKGRERERVELELQIGGSALA